MPCRNHYGPICAPPLLLPMQDAGLRSGRAFRLDFHTPYGKAPCTLAPPAQFSAEFAPFCPAGLAGAFCVFHRSRPIGYTLSSHRCDRLLAIFLYAYTSERELLECKTLLRGLWSVSLVPACYRRFPDFGRPSQGGNVNAVPKTTAHASAGLNRTGNTEY